MQTVIGVFDDRIAAARALEILRTSGFDEDHVQLQGRPFVSEPAGQPPEEDGADDSMFGAMSHFLSSIFGKDDKVHADLVEEAVRRGGYVVTVDAVDEEEAEAVEALLDDTGAIDIDERAQEWRHEDLDASTFGAARGPGPKAGH